MYNYNIYRYDHEMITSLWKIFDTTYFSIMDNTDSIYSLCEIGLNMLYRLGTFYKLTVLLINI